MDVRYAVRLSSLPEFSKNLSPHVSPPPSTESSVPRASARPRNIVLVGFMGTGKTSIGRLLAEKTGFSLVDMDAEIEARASCRIAEIFEREGEAGFRARESDVLRSLAASGEQIVSTGGGIVTVAGNIPLLKDLGYVVWLRSSEDVIFDRVSRNQNRPMLQTDDSRATIRALLEERNPRYKACANLEVDTTELSLDETAYGIAQSAGLYFLEREG